VQCQITHRNACLSQQNTNSPFTPNDINYIEINCFTLYILHDTLLLYGLWRGGMLVQAVKRRKITQYDAGG